MATLQHPPALRNGAALALVALFLLQGCERIDPITGDEAMGPDAVTLTCEGCHTNRTYLQRLAIDDGSGGGGGGG